MNRRVIMSKVAMVLLMACATSANAVNILPVAVEGFSLPTNNSDTSQGSIAYHPLFDQYYGGDAGSTAGPGLVWSGTGTLLQSTAVSGVDFRAINYNPNTNSIEVVSFAALSTNVDADRGLFTMGLDGAGLYNGVNVESLVEVPGLKDFETTPAYNPITDELYSAAFITAPSHQIRVVSRATGALTGTIDLDLLSAGVTNFDLVRTAIGFDLSNNVLIALDHVANRALVFDLSGSYLGASQLPAFTQSVAYGLGYANGRLFVLDTNDFEYRSFQIFGGNAIPEPTTVTLGLIGMSGLLVRRRRADGRDFG